MTVTQELNIALFIVFAVYPMIAAIVILIVLVVGRRDKSKKS